MSNRKGVMYWVKVGLSQDPDQLQELFYFDEANQLFFSIHICDYFMITEDFEIDPKCTSPYTGAEEQKLLSWMKRVDVEDSTIIPIPRKGLVDDFIQEVEANKFLEAHNIDADAVGVWTPDDSGSMTINLDDSDPPNGPGKK